MNGMRRVSLLVLAGAVGASAVLSAQKRTVPTRPELTLEALSRNWDTWAGMSPGQIRWSPDGRSLYFDWNPERGDLASLYVVSAAGGPPRKLTPEDARLVPPAEPKGSHARDAVETNRSGSHVVFERQGDIFLLESATRNVKRITNTEALEQSPRFSPDQASVTYESSNNLFAYRLATGETVQLTNFRTGRPQGRAQTDQQKYLEAQQLDLFEFFRKTDRISREQAERTRRERGPRPAPANLADAQQVVDMLWSADGQDVIFTLVDDSRFATSKPLEQPSYVTKSGYVEVSRLGGDPPAVKPGEQLRDYRLGVVSVADGKVRYLDTNQFRKPVGWNTPIYSADGRHLVAWAGSHDHKNLWLYAIDTAAATARVLYHERDEAWVRGFRAGRFQRGDGHVTGFMPDNRSIYFLSERDGWFHLYTVSVDGGEPRQLTTGPFEVVKPVLSKDGSRWYFLSGEGDLFQRHLYTMPAGGGARTRITTKEGWYDDYALSPDEAKIAWLYENPAAPVELFVADNQTGAPGVPLTSSMSDEFTQYAWQVPDYITIPERDGWLLHAELFKPRQPHPLRPAIIHLHGTGWTQGVGKRFAPYLPETRLECQFFAEHGYTVLSIDYRASRGYGRGSRVSVYERLGTPELQSALVAVEYLVAKHGIDRKRIGVYGHSVGGYLTLMALFDHPGVFAAGVAQAPPTDNAHGPTLHNITRLLGTPLENDAIYRRTSPIYLAEKLQDRLLILHGMMDNNVPFQDAVRFTQRLIELKKTGWELAAYPVEAHIPRQETSLLDMERRRFALFESVLKAPAVKMQK